MTKRSTQKRSLGETSLIAIALLFLACIIYIPTINVFYQAFKSGIAPFLRNLVRPDFLYAIRLTLILAAIAVPLNTIFGLCAAWAITRRRFFGRAILLSIIDLPFSISPVVAGLMLILLYGRQGWFGGWLQSHGINVIFAFPGMVLATALVLTNARAMGEFGAVSVVSGNIANETQSLPLFVEEAYKQYETEAAYSAAVLLALLAVVTLILKEILERRTRQKA